MKKFSVLLTLAVLMVSSSVFAGSIDYLSNQSAKFLMTFHRTASTDASADIANYNPAGTALLPQGFYIDVSNQTLLKPYSQDYDIDFTAGAPFTAAYDALDARNRNGKQNAETALLPNVYMVYNFGEMGAGKIAAYAHVGVSAGGGSLEWTDGTAATQLTLTNIFAGNVTAQSFAVSSVYYTAHIGAAYAIPGDILSISLGGKIVKADRSLELEAWGQNAATPAYGNLYVKGRYLYEATGYTPVVGLDIQPVKELTIAARYEYETKLEFEYEEDTFRSSGINPNQPFVNAIGSGVITSIETVARGTLRSVNIYDKAKSDYNLPQIISLGVEFKVTPELAVMASGNYYMLSQAEMGYAYMAGDTYGIYKKELNSYFDNGWEAGLGATYLVLPELKIGFGYMYTESGAKDTYYKDAKTFLSCAGNPPLDSQTFGLGGTYSIAGTGADITIAGSWTHYKTQKYNYAVPIKAYTSATNYMAGTISDLGSASVSGEYKKDVYNIGIGAGYKI